MSNPDRKLRVLCDLRPALDGHSGIPQAARLLFRELAAIPSLHVGGLIQHGAHLLAPGLPSDCNLRDVQLSAHSRIDRLGRVVISIEEQRFKSHIPATAYMLWMTLAQLFGMKHKLTRFDGRRFPDYLWRRLFEKTLLPEDFDLVVNRTFRILRAPWHAHHLAGLWTRWLGSAKYPRIDTRGIDVLVSETPFPGVVSPGTALIIRYHDAIPLTMPHTIKGRRYHQAAHYNALKSNVLNGAWFACASESTRQVLLSLFPCVEARAVTIQNTISHHYYREDSNPSLVREIASLRVSNYMRALSAPRLTEWLSEPGKNVSFDYLLTVSTLEPRKNHLKLLSAWEQLRTHGHPDLKLIVVGERGWQSEEILRAFRPWMERADLLQIEDVPTSELRVLYRHAKITVCPSLAEGFGYPGIESLYSAGTDAASDIPAHREVYGAAAAYFNPHSATDMRLILSRTITEQQVVKLKPAPIYNKSTETTSDWTLLFDSFRVTRQ